MLKTMFQFNCKWPLKKEDTTVETVKKKKKLINTRKWVLKMSQSIKWEERKIH